jgi:hypothetical protein
MASKFDFKGLDQPFEADWPVTVQVPQDGGTVEPQTFMARFRMIPPETVQELIKSDDQDLYVKTLFVGLGAGEEADDFEALRAKMLSRPYVRLAIQRSFSEFQAGVPAKN